MKVESHTLGTLVETDSFLVLLGNREAQMSALQTHFPTLTFKRIKQVHGDRVVHTSPHSIDFASEADAHYTSDKSLGLCISTADCIPLFMYHHQSQWICGIHAGWRSVEKRIAPKAIAALKRVGCRPADLKVFVGPHIQMHSFEVGNDVRDSLMQSFAGDKSGTWEPLTEQKSRVDLNQILRLQLLESDISLENSFFEVKNTVTDTSYHSFRRDRENSGRQLSFIALKK